MNTILTPAGTTSVGITLSLLNIATPPSVQTSILRGINSTSAMHIYWVSIGYVPGAVGSFSTASLPIQRQFTIGGPGVLNGYPLYAFSGDRGYLFNIEYFYSLPELFFWRNRQFDFDFNLFLVFFLDAGQAWNFNRRHTHTLMPKSDAGIGFQFGENNSFLRFNVAQAFESEQGVQFNVIWFYSF